MRPSLLLLLAAVVSCSPRTGPDPLQELPRWTATEDLRIGSVDDEETALTFFRDVVVGPGGRMATVQDPFGAVFSIIALANPAT